MSIESSYPEDELPDLHDISATALFLAEQAEDASSKLLTELPSRIEGIKP
jgi:hypothetical protein